MLKETLTPSLRGALRYIPGQEVVYVQNPKVACTTIKECMWLRHDAETGIDTYTGNPHGPARQGPFLAPALFPEYSEEITLAEWFTVVRNPFTRVLSAYLNKLHPRRPGVRKGENNARMNFLKRHGLSADAVPAFHEFLTILAGDDPEQIDPHFRPQWLNVGTPADLSYDFIGRLESWHDTASWLGERGFTVPEGSRNATGASGRLAEFYGPEEEKLARDLYARDFELFGYSADITDCPEGSTQRR